METYPNQFIVEIHRTPLEGSYLSINKESWYEAYRDLNSTATILYLYLASNKDGYELALSPKAIDAAMGMKRSTYLDQLHKLMDKGYLIQTGGNRYAFYETPQPQLKSAEARTAFVNEKEKVTGIDFLMTESDNDCTGNSTEIYNNSKSEIDKDFIDRTTIRPKEGVFVF